MAESADIVIVGGGPVGAALALALCRTGIDARILESRPATAAGADPRPLALSHGSRLILDRLEVWPRLEAVTPIERIHVSQRGGFGRAVLTADEAGLPALGYVVEYARLHAVLASMLAERTAALATGVAVTSVRSEGERAIVEFACDGVAQAVAARLVVVADGGALPDLGMIDTVDYRQAALVAMVTSELPHRNVAFERFTSGGPLALLPCGDEWALVWTLGLQAAQHLCDQPEPGFLCELGRAFGGRLGAFTAARGRARFPLVLRYARDVTPSRTVLIGNAAQTLHPVAGQGFNLGLRDAWELAGAVGTAEPAALGSAAMLAAYRQRRSLDRRGGLWFTHSLVRVFSNDLAPLRLARGMGLALLGCVPPAKDFVVRRMTFGSRG